jgi:hypothetical protein
VRRDPYRTIAIPVGFVLRDLPYRKELAPLTSFRCPSMKTEIACSQQMGANLVEKLFNRCNAEIRGPWLSNKTINALNAKI